MIVGCVGVLVGGSVDVVGGVAMIGALVMEILVDWLAGVAIGEVVGKAFG
jgi:hypothetical protein